LIGLGKVECADAGEAYDESGQADDLHDDDENVLCCFTAVIFTRLFFYPLPIF
jgi:hypothetical protein